MDDRPDESKPAQGEHDDGRRATWSRRIAIVVLIAFAMFVLFNVMAVVMLAYRSVTQDPGGPFP